MSLLWTFVWRQRSILLSRRRSADPFNVMTALEPRVVQVLFSDFATSGHLSWQCIIYSLKASADEAVIHETCALDALAVPTPDAVAMRPRPRCRGNDRLNVPRSHLSRCNPSPNCKLQQYDPVEPRRLLQRHPNSHTLLYQSSGISMRSRDATTSKSESPGGN
jgi:hypothetical protein